MSKKSLVTHGITIFNIVENKKKSTYFLVPDCQFDSTLLSEYSVYETSSMLMQRRYLLIVWIFIIFYTYKLCIYIPWWTVSINFKIFLRHLPGFSLKSADSNAASLDRSWYGDLLIAIFKSFWKLFKNCILMNIIMYRATKNCMYVCIV